MPHKMHLVKYFALISVFDGLTIVYLVTCNIFIEMFFIFYVTYFNSAS